MKVRTRIQIRMTHKEWIIILTMGGKQIPRANLKEKGKINPLTIILESVEEPQTHTILGIEKFVKEHNGMKMVRQLPLHGLDPSNFALICVHSLLKTLELYWRPSKEPTLIF